ncbi:MAG: hypothetical protein DCF25_05460 [Leptolyngbya foveolarum]|uniref:Uncharacterized protein n=1 Tax=Leptolyngbya foveolarum TaxID=47253 RepID=A0A2W4UL54_9CYAN|nr:MAG: hypothetical protein DCF25_05460 [Leptolyngbya foveolarum]
MVVELDKQVMQAVEALDYRVTVGDVAAKAGLNVEIAQQGLLALASETQGHMQVSDSGEIAYEFSRNFRGVLRNKYWQLRLQAILSKVWNVLFYIIRISFGIILMVLVAAVFLAIFALTIAAQSQGGGDNRDNRGGGGFYISPFNFFYLFNFNYGRGGRRNPNRSVGRSSRSAAGRSGEGGDRLNFLEAIFSFLFGDGDPNADLEERRWRTIGNIIRNDGGAIIAEQVVPYLDDLGSGWDKEFEDYMLPVLTRFNGQPEVSPAGEMVYYFPELQVSAVERGRQSVGAYLKETKRKFTQASSDQVLISIGLGALLIIGSLVLRTRLPVAIALGFGGLAQLLFWLALGYGIAFLAVPLGRYYWVQWRNRKIERRNAERAERAEAVNRLGASLKEKLAFARQFASQKILRADEAVYSTESGLLEQEVDRADQLEAEFRRRLNET